MGRQPQYVDLSALIHEEHLKRSWALPTSRFWWVVIGLTLMVVFLLGVDMYV